MELGQKVRDKVSGFSGIATGRAEYLYTTPTVLVSPEQLDSNGNRIAAVWLEESQVELADIVPRVVGYSDPPGK